MQDLQGKRERCAWTAGCDMRMGTETVMEDEMDQSRPLAHYVLITPARNEEAFIEKTIESMIHQTVAPLKWVIVDDGSTDRTPEIVSRYLASVSLDRDGPDAATAGPQFCCQSWGVQRRI